MSPLIVLAQEQEDEPGVVYQYFIDRYPDSEWIATLADALLVRSVRILLILVVAYVVNRILRRVLKRVVRQLAAEGGMSRLGALRAMAPLGDTNPMDIGRLTMRAETIGGVLRSIATATIWGIAFVMILGEFEVNLGPLIAGAGIVGVALGFGSQKLVQDFLSGIFMLLEDQYGIGDIVDVGEAIGVIEAITLRTTRLRDVNGTVWHVPNGEIRRVGNQSQEWSRCIIDIGVAYDTDIPFATEVIKRVADGLWKDPEWSDWVIEEPEVWGVETFGPSEIVIRLVVKTTPGKQFKVNRAVLQRIKAEFDREGIEIPFPQQTVWYRNSGGNGEAEPALEGMPRTQEQP